MNMWLQYMLGLLCLAAVVIVLGSLGDYDAYNTPDQAMSLNEWRNCYGE